MEVLAVDIEKQFANGLELRNRHRIPVDKGTRTPVGIDDAPQQAFVVEVECLLLEPCGDRGQTRDIEFSRKLGAPGAVAHQLGAAALAEDQPERVHENGLAGAGFTGQHGHSRFELDIDLVDDRKIANLQVHQHVRACPF